MKQEKYIEALTHFDLAARINPSSSVLRCCCGTALRRMCRLEDALKQLKVRCRYHQKCVFVEAPHSGLPCTHCLKLVLASLGSTATASLPGKANDSEGSENLLIYSVEPAAGSMAYEQL